MGGAPSKAGDRDVQHHPCLALFSWSWAMAKGEKNHQRKTGRDINKISGIFIVMVIYSETSKESTEKLFIEINSLHIVKVPARKNKKK